MATPATPVISMPIVAFVPTMSVPPSSIPTTFVVAMSIHRVIPPVPAIAVVSWIRTVSVVMPIAAVVNTANGRIAGSRRRLHGPFNSRQTVYWHCAGRGCSNKQDRQSGDQQPRLASSETTHNNNSSYLPLPHKHLEPRRRAWLKMTTPDRLVTGDWSRPHRQ